jgi:hypothetical protein
VRRGLLDTYRAAANPIVLAVTLLFSALAVGKGIIGIKVTGATRLKLLIPPWDGNLEQEFLLIK